ncbi:hypothetical protein QT381_02805 [Galbitalea sp. SE-J8]|uniref:hypothetical protein n=1 Tax=Galbitalea sp. SE-J8 TaxID=3054952 RepID=UPI00259CBE80|nr:hypothetical protein [Galbitalea sp. SE-J8]MDM4761934.1 hypothetical protein [Galbitalea sp. SE-J8]
MGYIGATVTVWTAGDGTPERLVWNRRRYRVSDTPTLLELDWAAITHPPSGPPIWRFQGTDEQGSTRVFDVRHIDATDEWWLLRAYD